MKKTLLSTTLLSLLLFSCNSTESEHDSHESIKENIDTSSAEVEIPTKPWKDSLAEFDVFMYAQMLDSNLLRNNNTEKMFLAKPKYTRCQDKGWKSAFNVNIENNFLAYQTTNSDEEYKVMGYGYEPEYHEESEEDTITRVKVWKIDDYSNLIFTSSNTEIGGYDNATIDVRMLRHDSTGMHDVTEELLPQIKFEDFLSVPIDSTDLSIPKFLPLLYDGYYNDNDIFMVRLNRFFIDKKKKYGDTYDWMQDFYIKEQWSNEKDDWESAVYFKFENGKFVKARFADVKKN